MRIVESLFSSPGVHAWVLEWLSVIQRHLWGFGKSCSALRDRLKPIEKPPEGGCEMDTTSPRRERLG